jgi:HSP20 family protein
MMTMASQPEQTVPVQLHRAQGRLVLAAPMPGLEPQDISVRIHHGRVTIRGEYRGSRHDQPETVISEWTMGPYHRDLSLPQPVSGELTNATYGNGVLVLAMPTLEPGVQEDATEFRLEADTGTRGQRVGHIGSEIEPAIPTENRPQNEWAVDNK